MYYQRNVNIVTISWIRVNLAYQKMVQSIRVLIAQIVKNIIRYIIINGLLDIMTRVKRLMVLMLKHFMNILVVIHTWDFLIHFNFSSS